MSILWDSSRAQNSISILKKAAEALEDELTCAEWDCECAFTRQRGCCCASLDLRELEDDVLLRVVNLSATMSQIQIASVSGGMRVAFTAHLSLQKSCLGPFTKNIPIPYDDIILNHGSGFNPALGIFTAPRPGVYSFSYSVYSKLERSGARMYFKVQLMKNGEAVASTWEDNREDSEGSGTHVVLLSLSQGSQVHVELLSGRRLCGNVRGLNTFAGSLLYPMLA
ncbi:cerebellin-2-like [Vanacampus margaritifer]